MKITRGKKLQKYLNFYNANFGFREPYQILIDATFCHVAINNKFSVQEQLNKYFQTELKLLTTQCIILEAEKLGPKIADAAFLVKKFPIHKCDHEKSPIAGSNCLKSMIKKSHYVIATQDKDLQEYFRKKAGQPLLYLHRVTPVLEAPSQASKTKAKEKLEEKVHVNKQEENKLNSFKRKEGIIVSDLTATLVKKKRKKNPNPLSSKKKKVKPNQELKNKTQILNKTIERKTRKRLNISRHIKEHLTFNSMNR